jgi:hypothetical protein
MANGAGRQRHANVAAPEYSRTELMMAINQTTTPPPFSGHDPILARDDVGAEHLMSVTDHPAGMVTMFDDEIVRIMAPRAAIESAVMLIEKAGKHFSAGGSQGWRQ